MVMDTNISSSAKIFLGSLLAMIALAAVQSSAQTFIYNAILLIDTSDNA